MKKTISTILAAEAGGPCAQQLEPCNHRARQILLPYRDHFDTIMVTR
jgi:hypothetical protein